MPPELTGPSGYQYVIEDSPVSRKLDYQERLGLPPPHSYVWRRNNQSFHGNSRVKLEGGNLTLSVRFASRQDSGEYELTAVSRSGTTSLIVDLLVICTLSDSIVLL